MPATVVRPPAGQDDDLVAGAHDAGSEPAGIAAVVAVLGASAADDVLHRHPRAAGPTGRRRRGTRLEVLEQRRAGVPGRAVGAVDDVVAERAPRPASATTSSMPKRVAWPRRTRRRSRRTASAKSTRSILLTASDDVPHAAAAPVTARWRRVCSTTPCRASIEDERELGGRGAGDHVAGVLDVAGGVGEDVGARRRREVAVGDVDGDALLALGPQAVGEQRQVGGVAARAPG